MENLTGKWGWIGIDEISNEYFKKYIHIESFQKSQEKHLSDYVFQCIKVVDDNYLQVKSTEIEIVVKRDIFRIMPEQPFYKPLEKVAFLNSKGFLEFGIIKEIHWHNNDRKIYYKIEVNGKMKGRRYYDEDLEKIE